MAGKARTKLLNTSIGLVEGLGNGPSWQFLYETSTVKHPDYDIGDRVVLPDGRTFFYGKAGDAAITLPHSRMVFNRNVIAGIATTHGAEDTPTVAVVAGDHVFRFGDTVARAVDHYVGGHYVQHDLSTGNGVFCAGIIASTAGDGTFVELTLDAKFPGNVPITSQGTAMPSIYSNVGHGGTAEFKTAVGLAVVNAAVSAYVWIQTWGLTWITPTAWGSTGPGCATGLRDVYVHTDGTIMPKLDDSGVARQRVGTIANMGDGSAYGDGVMMLQVNP